MDSIMQYFIFIGLHLTKGCVVTWELLQLPFYQKVKEKQWLLRLKSLRCYTIAMTIAIYA